MGNYVLGGDRVALGEFYLSMISESIREEGSVKGGVYRGDRN